MNIVYKILALVAITVVCCNATQNSTTEVEKFFESANNIINIYNEELDKKVKWTELNKAINAIDEFLIKYEGSARDLMADLRTLNAVGYNNYVFAVQPLVNWCGSIDGALEYVIQKLNNGNNTLSDKTRSTINRKVKRVLKLGKMQLSTSISKIGDAIQNIKLLATKIREMEYKLAEDFSPNGYYGKKRELIENRSRGWWLLALVVPVILSIVTGPIGIALSLSQALITAGLTLGVIHGVQKPSDNEQLIIMDTFFKSLETGLKQAKDAANAVYEALRKENSEINDLESTADANDPDDIEDHEFDQKFGRTLQNLKSQCNNYISSHGAAIGIEYNRRNRSITPVPTAFLSFRKNPVQQISKDGLFYTSIMRPVHILPGWEAKI